MSPKSPRGDALSDVIFKGTDDYRPAGMAEVTLVFENDGEWHADDEGEWGEAIPREYREMAELSITRRLHQSGESEYLINRAECRLRDIRDFLAGTGLGKQGYSIVEQGEVNFIVNAKPAERRLLIEEASDITRYKDKRKRAQRKLDQTRENLQRVEDVMGEVRKRLRRLERQAERAETHQRPSDELERLRVDAILRERAKLVEAAEGKQEAVDELQDSIEETEDELDSLESSLEEAKSSAEECEAHHSEVTETFYDVESKLNVAQFNEEHAREAIEQAETRLEEARNEQEDRREQLEKRIEAAQQKAQIAERNCEELSDRHSDLEEIVEEAKEALDEAKETVREREVELAEARKDLESSRKTLQTREMEPQELTIEIEHADEALAEQFEFTLEEASEDLETAIAKMDRESRRRFRETFQAVDETFQEMFEQLFGGGEAELIMTDPDDLLETAVDIDVRPPGQKLQNVSLLSGGEKAMTAASLIFALFKLNPRPFAILDEVDAPLDEANVGRYVQLVQDLSEMSQMLLITHNRRTMESVDTLYGVTMQEPGVTQLISLDLSEVDERLAS